MGAVPVVDRVLAIDEARDREDGDQRDAVRAQEVAEREAQEFFGRCNVLLGEDERVLARIVEVLRPAESMNA